MEQAPGAVFPLTHCFLGSVLGRTVQLESVLLTPAHEAIENPRSSAGRGGQKEGEREQAAA